ncbi:MAG: hypothetical protein MJ207_01615 [Bacilli bacterium]|nr:hypothetical protein [Bacilli bacterium]
MSILIELVQLEELFDPVTSDGLGAQIYLDSKAGDNFSLIHYPSAIDGPLKYKDKAYLEFKDTRDYTLDIINDPDNTHLLSETDIPNLFNFFVFGYDASYEEMCGRVADWSSLPPGVIPEGDEGYKQYEGSPYRQKANTERTDFINALTESITSKLESEYLIELFKNNEELLKKLVAGEPADTTINDICQIPARSLRAFCSQFNIVGFNKPIFKKTKISETHTENYGINYLGLKDLDFKFNGVNDTNKMDAYVTLDVNGQDSFITLDTTLQSNPDGGKITFKLDDAYLGQISTSKKMEGLQTAIIELIKDKTATSGTDHPLFSFDENNNLTIDIASMLPDGSGGIFEGGIDIQIDLPQLGTKTVNVKAALSPKIQPLANDDEYVLSLGADVTAIVKNQ